MKPPASTRQAKIDWLLARQREWAGLYPSYETRDDPRLEALAMAAVAAGLYSTETMLVDVRISIMQHMQRARSERRRLCSFGR